MRSKPSDELQDDIEDTGKSHGRRGGAHARPCDNGRGLWRERGLIFADHGDRGGAGGSADPAEAQARRYLCQGGLCKRCAVLAAHESRRRAALCIFRRDPQLCGRLLRDRLRLHDDRRFHTCECRGAEQRLAALAQPLTLDRRHGRPCFHHGSTPALRRAQYAHHARRGPGSSGRQARPQDKAQLRHNLPHLYRAYGHPHHPALPRRDAFLRLH